MDFFDKSATVNVFRKQPENPKTGTLAFDRRAITATPFPEPAATTETL